MNDSQPTVSEIRTAKRQAVGGGRKRCKRGKNCSAACIQAGMVCLVEMPESAGVSLGKVSNFLQNRAPSVPSGMKRELAALGQPQQFNLTGQALLDKAISLRDRGFSKGDMAIALGYQKTEGGVKKPDFEKFFEDLKAAKEKAEERKPANDLAKWGTDQLQAQRKAAWALGKDDKVAAIDGELARRGKGDMLDIKAKTVDKSVAPVSATGDTRYARGDAKDFDFDLSSGSLRRVGDKKYFGWNDSYDSGSKAIGEGSYGSVIRNKDGTYVKRGAISDTEADLIKILGKKDLGPRLIAADINGKHGWHEESFVDIRNGRIAMSRVPGQPLGETTLANQKIAGKNAADIYWKALGDLHRAGIAHNDAHIDNIMVDEKGKGRWVDLGLAQKSPKAAFAEAFGTFSPGAREVFGSNGNWQTPRWSATGVKDWNRESALGQNREERFINNFPVFGKVLQNRSKVAGELRRMGYTTSEMATLQNTPIRSNLSAFEQGPWAKMTDAQAQKLINLFYDGI